MAQQNPKFKIKEFEWFEMETKVRQIIQEVLGPMQKRILETSNVLHKVKVSQTDDQDKINQITLMIANDPKVFQTGVFQKVDERFEEQTKHIEELSRQIKEASKYVDEKFKILDIRMEESSEVLRNVASLRERISKEIELQNDNINQLRNNLTDMISNLEEDMKANRRLIQSNFEIGEKERLQLGEKIRTINGNIQNIDAILQGHKDMHRQKALKLEEHSQNLTMHREEIDGLQESKNLTKKLQEFVKHMDNELTRAEFKIDNISPLITQAQISDCLFAVLPNKLKKRVSIHEYKKYYHLNREVLDKPYKEVVEKFRGIQLLEDMQKRNTKEIVQMKRKKLLAMGIDIDHLTYEQRERYYAQVQLDEAAGDQDDEVKISNKVDQKQIVNLMQLYFGDFTNEVSEKVRLELDDSKKYMFEMEDQFRREMRDFEGKYEVVRRECETYHTEQLLQNKAVERGRAELEEGIERVRGEVGGVRELQRLFYNFCSLVNHLEIQDEIDKQNISLMGVQENSGDSLQPRDKNSILELDKKCFSCCGYPASTLSAFKMACLTYNPSPIRIDTKEYKREELLEFTTSMLHNIKKSIQVEAEGGSGMSGPPLRTTQTIQPTVDKDQETYEQSKFLGKLETEEAEGSNKKTAPNKFRKTKKYVGLNNNYLGSAGKQGRSRSKNGSFLNEEMSHVSAAFNELKRRNISFLC